MTNDVNTEALMTIVNSLKDMDTDAQKRTLSAVIAFLDIQLVDSKNRGIWDSQKDIHSFENTSFTQDRSMSPKDFLRDKAPGTDIERVACLAYYLTHYRDQPHFKTVDISALNTEAAQPKFSNATLAANNALTAGLLVQAGRGSKQISATGETFVQLLPDRDAARESLKGIRKRRVKKARVPKAK